ncbi:GntR family transcriptional regulator [Sphaerisporangium melleum]|uniref:GntR family transcriptional regulator n=1 Tax=Sphaerisporangium melleum TaxID=321316 RepID=A0A917RR52_9ACTN|nr:FadR/GntR family transcriptional regulator [Sphaerisporangium melleum]GGL21576.1 GntR family transcriptional regulator [Sphaerisporangium melleum]GII74841.1 GntR family transcriptional regulator [Sphaerisporangium melleum]
MSLTQRAIVRIRELIKDGTLPPGTRLPPEHELAAELGLSRNLLREAVRSLVTTRVLEVRRGDGTYVTSLKPELLLEGVGLAVEMMRGDDLLEIAEVRRLFEPVATGLAATRITAGQLAGVESHLDAMIAARDEVELLNHHDDAFHRAVLEATGNKALCALLGGIASRTLRSRVWRGLVEGNVADRTIAEHTAIYQALAHRDAPLAQAAALMHVSTTETWLREKLQSTLPAPGPL